MSNTAINNIDIIKKVFDIDDVSFSSFTGSLSIDDLNTSNAGYVDRPNLGVIVSELNKVTDSISNSVQLFPLPAGFKVIYLMSFYSGVGLDGLNSTNILPALNLCQIRHGIVDSNGNYKLEYVGTCYSELAHNVVDENIITSSFASRAFFTEAPFIENQQTAYFAGIRICSTFFGPQSGTNLNFLFMLSRLKIYAMRVRIA